MLKQIKRVPYVKVVSEFTGEVLNPITKENPYLNKAHVSLQKLFNYRKQSKFKIWEANRNKFFKGKIAVGA